MYLLLNADDAIIALTILYIFLFVIGVFVTRWIFGIPKIIRLLESNNELLENNNQFNLVQIKLLQKSLTNSGVSDDEIDDIIKSCIKKK